MRNEITPLVPPPLQAEFSGIGERMSLARIAAFESRIAAATSLKAERTASVRALCATIAELWLEMDFAPENAYEAAIAQEVRLLHAGNATVAPDLPLLSSWLGWQGAGLGWTLSSISGLQEKITALSEEKVRRAPQLACTGGRSLHASTLLSRRRRRVRSASRLWARPFQASGRASRPRTRSRRRSSRRTVASGMRPSRPCVRASGRRTAAVWVVPPSALPSHRPPAAQCETYLAKLRAEFAAKLVHLVAGEGLTGGSEGALCCTGGILLLSLYDWTQTNMLLLSQARAPPSPACGISCSPGPRRARLPSLPSPSTRRRTPRRSQRRSSRSTRPTSPVSARTAPARPRVQCGTLPPLPAWCSCDGRARLQGAAAQGPREARRAARGQGRVRGAHRRPDAPAREGLLRSVRAGQHASVSAAPQPAHAAPAPYAAACARRSWSGA